MDAEALRQMLHAQLFHVFGVQIEFQLRRERRSAGNVVEAGKIGGEIREKFIEHLRGAKVVRRVGAAQPRRPVDRGGVFFPHQAAQHIVLRRGFQHPAHILFRPQPRQSCPGVGPGLRGRRLVIGHLLRRNQERVPRAQRKNSAADLYPPPARGDKMKQVIGPHGGAVAMGGGAVLLPEEHRLHVRALLIRERFGCFIKFNHGKSITHNVRKCHISVGECHGLFSGFHARIKQKRRRRRCAISCMRTAALI